MEEGNPVQPPVKRNRRSSSDALFNILTILIGLAILLVLVFTAIIFTNPNSALNPFAPPTIPPMIVLPSATATPLRIAATWTPTPTNIPTETPTPLPPTETPTITNTFSMPLPRITGSVSPSPTVSSKFSFVPQADPIAVDATIFNPSRTCDWTGIAGQIVDLRGRPVIGVTVHLTGFFAGKSVDIITLSGLYRQYGESGYEFDLGTKPVNTQNLLQLELEDQAGLPLSDKIYISTYSDCAKNLIVVNFKQVK